MTDTKEEIMRTGRLMAQAGGYQSLSFRDIAEAVGVKSASIHYHFPTKGTLGAALASRYADDMGAFLGGLTADHVDITTTLRTYTELFRQPLLNSNRMCLCGIMAAEHDQLPAEVRDQVNRFTEVNVTWLAHLLLLEKIEKTKVKAQRRALAIFSSIEGAQLIARGKNDVTSYDETIDTYRLVGLIP